MSSFKHNLVKARSALVFLIGLTLAFWLVYSLETWNPEVVSTEISSRSANKITFEQAEPDSRQHRALTLQEKQWAKTAWRYFENNYIPETGLVNSADKYPAATMWDTSSYLLGMISARRLDIIDEPEFNKRVSALLKTLGSMPLFEDLLPNKSYNTRNVAMVTYNNEETDRGIGWSAIDVGRIMVPLNILVWHFPKHNEGVNQILAHWDLDALISDAELYGTDISDAGQTLFLQEGRLGYEEYAAKSLALVGRDVGKALDYELHTKLVDIYGIDIATDGRKPSEFGALNYVVSEPYILDGVEYGWDRYSRELSRRVFNVQQSRYEQTGVLTAVSEDNIDQAPYFVYNTVFADDKAWNAITESGEDASEYRSVSTKAVLGFHALYDNDYTARLVAHISSNYDAKRGWYSGIYEASGEPNRAITANTNGIILESLHYIKFGPMMSMRATNKALIAEADEE